MPVIGALFRPRKCAGFRITFGMLPERMFRRQWIRIMDIRRLPLRFVLASTHPIMPIPE